MPPQIALRERASAEFCPITAAVEELSNAGGAEERVAIFACFMTTANSRITVISQPAQDLTFARFTAALRGHATTFLGSQS